MVRRRALLQLLQEELVARNTLDGHDEEALERINEEEGGERSSPCRDRRGSCGNPRRNGRTSRSS